MNVNGSLPLHIARAYGVPSPAPAPPPVAAPTAPQAAGGARLQNLVGGAVSQQATPPAAVDPVTAATGTGSATGPYQLYTRVADRIEAAVAVQLGRSIDISG